VKRLRQLGIKVMVGHAAENLGDAKVVVISSAIKPGNPEVEAARERLLPIVRRAEMLAELMRLKWCVSVAGTHGKTTTTSMVAAVLDAGKFDPTVINGGIINAYGTNARLGAGDWMVVEADESDGTFLKLPTDVAIITNIDPEHLDHFHTYDAVKDAFHAFVNNIPFYGFAVMCIDHPAVQELVGQIEDRRVITYGENPQADVLLIYGDHQEGRSRFSIAFRDRAADAVHAIADLTLPMPGRHNALNATAAIAVARELGVPDDRIRNAIASFSGVGRRFTRTGAWNGVTVIDDYGHHPVEIAAVLKAARETASGQVIAVMQPHRYTRLSSLFEQFCTCFNDADTVIVAPVYPAGEAPIAGADRDSLVAGIRARGHRNVIGLDGPAALAGLIKGIAQPGDFVVCLGAGNITQWAYALPGELAALGAAA
jgi:UDP-N-acetylmuramate--alanine ligase